MTRTFLPALLAALIAACGQSSPSPEGAGASASGQKLKPLTIEQLKDPETCQGCHPKQYEEWRGSMHAYAAVDPVFLAMNKRGQRETDGKLGDFCVKCHAPVAVREGLTADGLNLDELPAYSKGVTCYFCHSIDAIGEEHNNANLSLAEDGVLRGAFTPSVDPVVHGATSSELHKSSSMQSSRMCGTCHDVVNPAGMHIERTLAEYEDSIFSIERSGKNGGNSCNDCHMRITDTGFVAAQPSMQTKKRSLHEHRWPGVDVALTDFPNREAHTRATECALTDSAWILSIENQGAGRFVVTIETDAGHNQPSGVSADRRLWLELVAYDENDKVIFQSGVIKDGEPEEYPQGDPKHDRQLCIFRDVFEDDDGHEVHMFWDATRKSGRSRSILPAKSRGETDGAKCTYSIPGLREPARVEMRMHMRPIGYDVLKSLIDSGDLEPEIVKEVPTFTIARTHVEWTREQGNFVRVPMPKSTTPDYCFE